MTDSSVRYLWDDSDKRVKRLEIPEQSGMMRVHQDFLDKTKKVKKEKKHGRKH